MSISVAHIVELQSLSYWGPWEHAILVTMREEAGSRLTAAESLTLLLQQG
jgi:hypothetical protein